MIKDRTPLLVGDNPFHGISHLSQERARSRGEEVMTPQVASELVLLSLENGANGFTFSVSETTLSILERLCESDVENLELHPIVPYAYEYVRLLVQTGGFLGVGKGIALQTLTQKNFQAVAKGFKGVVGGDLSSLMEAYLSLELSRVKSAMGRNMKLETIMLHEMVTDVALSMDWKWVFETHMSFMEKNNVSPGFETRNLPLLAKKFGEWGLASREMELAAPFNKVGFQMVPSRKACEDAVSGFSKADIIAINILASGYLEPREAVKYILELPGVDGVAAGVSKKHHARETFAILSQEFETLQNPELKAGSSR